MSFARYVVASEQMTGSGPVAAVVRAVGYVSEDEAAAVEEHQKGVGMLEGAEGRGGMKTLGRTVNPPPSHPQKHDGLGASPPPIFRCK